MLGLRESHIPEIVGLDVRLLGGNCGTRLDESVVADSVYSTVSRRCYLNIRARCPNRICWVSGFLYYDCKCISDISDPLRKRI